MSIHDSKDDTGPGPLDLAAANRQLHALDAEGRVRWALEHLPGTHALSSSFGAQAAVSLHLVTRLAPGIPVVVIDTGYLFPETYQFIDELSARLSLNLRVHRAPLTPGWLEAREGRLWEQGSEGIERFSRLTKVEPMQHALSELGVGTWIAGLRRSQSRSRAAIEPLARQDGRFKLSPILDWTDRDVYVHLKRHKLPYHPLWHQGYVSIGDMPTTRPLGADLSEEQTRFHGLRRECGLHGLDG
jgi:phosphoadenosine phosphosulfate reductase